MTRSPLPTFGTLAREAILDAFRRRIALAVAFIAFLSLLLARSCIGAASGTFTVDGQPLDVTRIAGFLGIAVYAGLALWTIVLAGVLASDHLTQPLQDGTAPLTLARPVSRASFALARLAGSLAVSLSMGGAVLAASAWLLHVRHGLPLEPAVAGAAACAVGALAIAALAMALSLVLPRVAIFPLVFLGVGWISFVNLASTVGTELDGMSALLDRFGPPLGSALAHSLAPWIDRLPPGSPAEPAFRLCAWAAGSTALLIAAFRRLEIRA